MESNKYTRKIPESVYFYEADKDWWAGPFVKPCKNYNCVEYHLVPVEKDTNSNKALKVTDILQKVSNNSNKALKVTDILHKVNNEDMTELIDRAYTNINTVVKNLEKIGGEENQIWIKETLIREVGRNIEVTCDDSNNPPSALDHKVLVADIYYRVNNTSAVIVRELIFGKTENILQYKADQIM